MITGFNTDIQHDGVTYHVQTEDKGLDSPLILSLVYVGGAIIASKRSPYHDLIDSGFDEKALTERLQRQHKLICAAIRSGRVEELKRMGGERDGSPRPAAPESGNTAPTPATLSPPQTTGGEVIYEANGRAAGAENGQPQNEKREGTSRSGAKEPRVEVSSPEVEPAVQARPVEVFGGAAPANLKTAAPVSGKRAATSSDAQDSETVAPALSPAEERQSSAGTEKLYLNLLDDEGEFRAGQLAKIKIQAGRGAYGNTPIANAEVTIKVLGTTFRPLILSTRTDDSGLAVVRALLPRFTSGRAAIIIRVSAGDDVAELRRIIHQS